MALQMILDNLDNIPDVLKAEYKQGADGKFTLDVVGGEDVGALKRAKDHEKNLRVAAENKVTELTTALETANADLVTARSERDAAKAQQGSDTAALEASWQAKVTAAEEKVTRIETELSSEIERLLVTNTATAMAHEISTVPELFQDVIAKRLKVEKGADGKYFTRVLDEAGTPSAKTLDEFKQELLANKKYSTIIISGKGSGGGAGGSGGDGGADATKKFLDYSDAELVELRKNDPDLYAKLKKEHEQPKV